MKLTKSDKETSPSRRKFIKTAGIAGTVIGIDHLLPNDPAFTFGRDVIPGKERLIVRSVRPEDLETPVSLLNTWITPNELFYVRHHSYAAKVNDDEWKLT